MQIHIYFIFVWHYCYLLTYVLTYLLTYLLVFRRAGCCRRGRLYVVLASTYIDLLSAHQIIRSMACLPVSCNVNVVDIRYSCPQQCVHTHTHTHNRFMALWNLSTTTQMT